MRLVGLPATRSGRRSDEVCATDGRSGVPVQFRVLGAVEACTGASVWQLGSPQRRLVLAVLALEAGRTVSAETLVDCVRDDPPAGARRAVQVHIARIRKLLDRARGPESPVGLVRRSGGYLLDVDPQSVDVPRSAGPKRRAERSLAQQRGHPPPGDEKPDQRERHEIRGVAEH